MGNLYCQETMVGVENAGKDNEKRSGYGSGEPYETRFSTTGDLYRACVRQFGRCLGAMYVGDAQPRKIGWAFVRKNPQDNTLQETWVEVFVVPPTRTVSYSNPEYPTFK